MFDYYVCVSCSYVFLFIFVAKLRQHLLDRGVQSIDVAAGGAGPRGRHGDVALVLDALRDRQVESAAIQTLGGRLLFIGIVMSLNAMM